MFFYTFIMPMKPKYKIDDWSVNNKNFVYSVGNMILFFARTLNSQKIRDIFAHLTIVVDNENFSHLIMSCIL